MACIHYRAGCTRSYISGVPGPDGERTYGYARKSEKDEQISPPLSLLQARGIREDLCMVQTFFSRSAYIVSSVYEAHFKAFTLAFTLLCLYVYDRFVASFLATIPRRPPPLTPGISGLHPGLRTEPSFFLFPSPFHANPSSLSLNPRYPRADHLGKFIVLRRRRISNPDGAWEPNDLSHDVEYAKTSRGGDRSFLRVSDIMSSCFP